MEDSRAIRYNITAIRQDSREARGILTEQTYSTVEKYKENRQYSTFDKNYYHIYVQQRHDA